ncbi:MAG: peptide deformylase [Deltaproteobacteria bacterium]|nr:peptide deformylase [Deltaproteobacteria bacterium]
MSILTVLTYPDERLRVKAAPVMEVNAEVRRLMDEMVETMRAHIGIGLAATQVGVDKRVIVMEIPENIDDEEDYEEGDGSERHKDIKTIVYKFANPEIIASSGEVTFEEGCLSVPGVRADVDRFAEVTVRALDEMGKTVEIAAKGLMAIAFQHEIDHLDGVLFVDKLSRLKRSLILRKYKRLQEEDKED